MITREQVQDIIDAAFNVLKANTPRFTLRTLEIVQAAFDSTILDKIMAALQTTARKVSP